MVAVAVAGRLARVEVLCAGRYAAPPGQGCGLTAQAFFPHVPRFLPRPPSPQETLYYAAMLRLPSTMTRAQKRARVETVIAALGLGQCRDTIIGECCAGARAVQGHHHR